MLNRPNWTKMFRFYHWTKAESVLPQILFFHFYFFLKLPPPVIATIPAVLVTLFFFYVNIGIDQSITNRNTGVRTGIHFVCHVGYRWLLFQLYLWGKVFIIWYFVCTFIFYRPKRRARQWAILGSQGYRVYKNSYKLLALSWSCTFLTEEYQHRSLRWRFINSSLPSWGFHG